MKAYVSYTYMVNALSRSQRVFDGGVFEFSTLEDLKYKMASRHEHMTYGFTVIAVSVIPELGGAS